MLKLARQMENWRSGMPQADMDRRFSRKSGRTGSLCSDAGWDAHDQSSGSHLGERLLVTVTEQGSVRHLSAVSFHEPK